MKTSRASSASSRACSATPRSISRPSISAASSRAATPLRWSRSTARCRRTCWPRSRRCRRSSRPRRWRSETADRSVLSRAREGTFTPFIFLNFVHLPFGCDAMARALPRHCLSGILNRTGCPFDASQSEWGGVGRASTPHWARSKSGAKIMRMFARCLVTTSLVLLTSCPVIEARAADLDASSAIDAVTVFPDGASITRLITLEVPAGDTTVVARDFPLSLDKASLRVEGQAGQKLTIGAIDARPPPVALPVDLPELDRRIEALKDQRVDLQGAINAAAARRKFAE